MGRLQLDEALERAEVIAEVQIAGGLNAGKHQFGKRGHLDPHGLLMEARGLIATSARRRKGRLTRRS